MEKAHVAVHVSGGIGRKKILTKIIEIFLTIIYTSSDFLTIQYSIFFMPIGGKSCTARLRVLDTNLLL